MPRRKKESESPSVGKELSKLTTEKELEAVMTENNVASEKVISEYIDQLRLLEPSPEELRQKERIEHEIFELEDRNKEIDKQMREITRGAYAGILSDREEKEYRDLRNQKNQNKSEIKNLEWEIRNLSKNKMLNAKASQEYERSINECRSQIERLKKSRDYFNESGEKEAFEKCDIELFNEKKKLKQIESEKPQPLDERTELEIKGSEIRDMIRKSFLVRTAYYLERIAEAAEYSFNAEMLCLEIENVKGWKNYHGKPSVLDDRFFVSSFYSGVDWKIDGLTHIVELIENYK